MTKSNKNNLVNKILPAEKTLYAVKYWSQTFGGVHKSGKRGYLNF